MNNTRPQPWRRAVAHLLTLLMALGPLGRPRYAAVTRSRGRADRLLALARRRTSCMTVDDSTSMLSDFLPDYVIGAVPGARRGAEGSAGTRPAR